MWKGPVLAGLIAAQLAACALLMPEPTRNLGFLIQNRTRRDVNFSIGASDDAAAIGVAKACSTEVLAGAPVRQGDSIVLSDGGEVWRFDSLPSEEIGGMLVVIFEDGPVVVNVLDVNDRVPQVGRDDLCGP